jgi:hypothetical protein
VKEVKKNTERLLHHWNLLFFMRSMKKIFGHGDKPVGRKVVAYSVHFML